MTIGWLDEHIEDYELKIFDSIGGSKFKYLQKRKECILVEDFPNFENYDRIILIDRSYNKEANAKYRVKTPEELEKIFDDIKQEQYPSLARDSNGRWY